MKNNIILIGFMGCGKSSVGIRLSYRLRRPVIDTDKMIERLYRRTVSEIFGQLGEEEFRHMETQCLERLVGETERQIIATGGGLPLREKNRELMKRLGTVVYLRVTPETVCRRLAGDTSRPLLQGDDPEGKVGRLMAERAGIYEGAADLVIDADDKDADEIMEEILAELGRADAGDGLSNIFPEKKGEGGQGNEIIGD